MAFEHDKHPDEIHLYAASLEKPEDFSPQFHTTVRNSCLGSSLAMAFRDTTMVPADILPNTRLTLRQPQE
jgi:hypothetical protein